MVKRFPVHAVLGFLALFLPLLLPVTAEAATPVITFTTVPTDPAKFGWISENAKKTLADAIAQHKAGSLFAFVFVAGPGGDFWAYRSTAKETDFGSIDDLARGALETCEFSAGVPCFIVSISGNDARDPAGGFPLQPSLLADQPSDFDAARVPFVNLADVKSLQGYSSETKPKALVVTSVGGWLWRTGDNLFQAIAAGFADCQKVFPNQSCILYAVNRRVVFTAGTPQ